MYTVEDMIDELTSSLEVENVIQNPDIDIRSATEDDIGTWQDLEDGISEFEAEGVRGISKELSKFYKWSDSDYTLKKKDIIKILENTHMILYKGEVVGHLELNINLNSKPKSARITTIFIKDGYRGVGIGCTIMRYSEAICRNLGCKLITIGVRANNIPAKTLYEKSGFTPYHMSLCKEVK